MTRLIYYRAELTWADLTQADLTQGRVDPHSRKLMTFVKIGVSKVSVHSVIKSILTICLPGSVKQLTIENIDDLSADLRTFYYFKISRNKIPFEFPSDGVSVRNFP